MRVLWLAAGNSAKSLGEGWKVSVRDFASVSMSLSPCVSVFSVPGRLDSSGSGVAGAATDRRPVRAHAQSSLRMANGNDAAPGQFPHQVAIYIDMAAFCGGALISPKWILTAATCTSR